MKCLVTGAGGFIGGYLVRCLLENNYSVCAADTVPGAFLASLKGDVQIRPLDITSQEQTHHLIAEWKPDIIFHLAAQSYPSLSWKDPVATFNVNVLGTVHLMEAVKSAHLKPVIVVAGSSAEYAPVDTADRIHEDIPLSPSSPYGVSKLAEDMIGQLYCKQYAFHAIRVRPFFVVGPGKKGDVCSDFARGIVSIERGMKKELLVGHLSPVRDLLDIRDGVEAFRIVAESGQPGEVYNVCSGKGHSLREVLDIYKKLAKVTIQEKEDPARLRPLDEKIRMGDSTRLESLGWSPSVSIEQTLADILNYWREQPEE